MRLDTWARNFVSGAVTLLCNTRNIMAHSSAVKSMMKAMILPASIRILRVSKARLNPTKSLPSGTAEASVPPAVRRLMSSATWSLPAASAVARSGGKAPARNSMPAAVIRRTPAMGSRLAISLNCARICSLSISHSAADNGAMCARVMSFTARSKLRRAWLLTRNACATLASNAQNSAASITCRTSWVRSGTNGTKGADSTAGVTASRCLRCTRFLRHAWRLPGQQVPAIARN